MVEVLKRRKRRLYRSLLLGFSVSFLSSLASYLGYLDGFEARALDFLLWMRGTIRSPEIVLVEIDDQAFRNLGEKQPLPRSYLARLIDLVARSGAKVIALDIELKVPTNPREDQALLNAIEAAAENGNGKVIPAFVIRLQREEGGEILYARSPFFSPRLVGIAGFANAPVESDGFVRRIPLAVRDSNGKILPSLALGVLARFAGYDASGLEQALNQGQKPTLRLPEWDKFQGRLHAQPTPFSFRLEDSWKINFAGARGSFQSLPSDPLFALSKQNVPVANDNVFRGKIVLIGATFRDSRDFFPTPLGMMSGMEIHANVIHTLLSRSQILPEDRLLALIISLIFAVVTSLFLTLLRPAVVTLLSFAAIPVLPVFSYAAFARLGLWVDFVTPLLVIHWGAYAGAFFERRHIRRSLAEHVDQEVANRIVDQEESLAGQRRKVTVFFSDIRDYTTLCEGVPPEKVVGMLNELFRMMTEVVARYHGIINDFIGDAVMAVFGAPKEDPSHALDAVLSAIDIQEGLVRLNEKWQRQGIRPIRIGVGIHTGEVVAGIVGSEGRKKFTFTGDTVNTASRVEGLNKEFSTSILITRETLQEIDGRFQVRNCGPVKVKGRKKLVEIFEVVKPDPREHVV